MVFLDGCLSFFIYTTFTKYNVLKYLRIQLQEINRPFRAHLDAEKMASGEFWLDNVIEQCYDKRIPFAENYHFSLAVNLHFSWFWTEKIIQEESFQKHFINVKVNH